jgi:hypothetical protein
MILFYPTTVELRSAEQTLVPTLTADDPILGAGGVFPARSVPEYELVWDQQDNYLGLQQVRGIDGSPPRVNRVDVKRYMAQPGIYGEHITIDERELTLRAQMGTWGTPVDANDLVRMAQDQLLVRQLSRIRQICWSLLTAGYFQVMDPKGAILHTDSYTQRAYTAAVPWSTIATATPLADFRAVQLLRRGYSVTFGTGATAYMNQSTLNNMLSNTNSADLYGRRSGGLSTLNTQALVQELFTGDGLPVIRVYDEGYLDDTGTFQLFIPNNTVVVVGRRTTGVPIGEWRYTRNANNEGGGPGAYVKVFDRSMTHVPASLEVHRGFNGGPTLQFPSAIVVMFV